MGTLLASSIISKAQIIIQDTTGVRWPDTELLGWLNEGQREIVMLKPDASVKNESLALVAGTKQTIPSSGIILISVVRNMGVNGTTPGNAVRSIKRNVLDEQLPNWHSSAASATVIYVVTDPRNPKVFYTYPPQPSATPGQVEIVYSAAPTDVGAVGNAISVDDIYSGSLLDYCLFRAYSKDAEYAGNQNRAVAHYQKFMETLGAKEKVESATEATPQAR